MLLNEHVRRMREEVNDQHEQMREIENQRKSLMLEQEINAKRRELEDIQRQLNEQRRDELEIAKTANQSTLFMMAGQSSENSNPISQAVSNSHQRSTSAGGIKIESG